MRKIDDSGDFSRDWNDFKAGFSNDANYWLGNDQIHLLTKDGGCKLRVDLESLVSNARYWAEYSTFIVGNEATNYQVLIDGYSGDAGNPLAQINGTQFSSDDVDNDGNDQEECADKQDAGFWHQETCGTCTLTGGGSDFNCSTLPSGQEELKMSQMCLQCIDASIGRGKCVGVCMYLIDNKGHGQGQFSEGATSIGKGCELFYRRQ